jgi:hypothetical protein
MLDTTPTVTKMSLRDAIRGIMCNSLNSTYADRAGKTPRIGHRLVSNWGLSEMAIFRQLTCRQISPLV